MEFALPETLIIHLSLNLLSQKANFEMASQKVYFLLKCLTCDWELMTQIKQTFPTQIKLFNFPKPTY